MVRELKPEQRALAEYMSELSEAAWYAGWMDGLEFALWEAYLDVRMEYGCLVLTPAHRERLRALSRACDGWIVFNDRLGETWVPTTEWQRQFFAWQGTNPPGGNDG